MLPVKARRAPRVIYATAAAKDCNSNNELAACKTLASESRAVAGPAGITIHTNLVARPVQPQTARQSGAPPVGMFDRVLDVVAPNHGVVLRRQRVEERL